MAATKELIKRIRLTASAASITFYNIPQDFDGLELVTSHRDSGDSGEGVMKLTFNESGTGYSWRWLNGNGATASSTSSGTANIQSRTAPSTATANAFSSQSIYIPNYTSSNYKSVSIDSVWEANATTASQTIVAGLWSNTAAITSITIAVGVGSLVAYSSAALYGWKKGSDGTTTVS